MVCISASSDALWARRLAKFRGRGINAAAILIDSESFGGEAGTQDLLKRVLAAGQIYTYGLAQGDALSDVLSAGREITFQ